jgi:hypothetical protein
MFEHGDMENRVNSPKAIWKLEDISSGSGLASDLKGTEVLLSRLLRGPGHPEELRFYKR